MIYTKAIKLSFGSISDFTNPWSKFYYLIVHFLGIQFLAEILHKFSVAMLLWKNGSLQSVDILS